MILWNWLDGGFVLSFRHFQTDKCLNLNQKCLI